MFAISQKSYLSQCPCNILKFFFQIVIFYNTTQNLCVFKRHCKIFQYVLFRCKALKGYWYINRVGETYMLFLFQWHCHPTLLLCVIPRIYWKIYIAAKKLSLLPWVPSQKVPKWLVSLGTKFFVTSRRRAFSIMDTLAPYSARERDIALLL